MGADYWDMMTRKASAGNGTLLAPSAKKITDKQLEMVRKVNGGQLHRSTASAGIT